MIQIPTFARRDPYPAALLASAVSVALHIGTWLTWQAAPAEITPVQTPPQVIEVALTAPAVKQLPAVAPQPETPPEQAQQQKPAPKKTEKPKPKTKKPKPPPKPVSTPAQKPVLSAVPTTPDNTDSAPKPAGTAPTQAAAKPSAPAPLVKAIYSSPSLNNPPTHYPRIAQMRQWEGTVKLEVQVLANGSAGEVRIVGSSGHEILDDSAIEQVKTWRFIPAHQGDKTVEDWVRVPITFKFNH